MGVFRQQERRGLVERRSLGAIPISCSEARLEFSKEASGGEVRRRARAGWTEAGKDTGRLLQPRA